MAVGDIVNGIQAGGDFTFQPAGSNVICITSFGSWSNSSQLANGTIVAYMKQSLSGTTMSATANKLWALGFGGSIPLGASGCKNHCLTRGPLPPVEDSSSR